MLIILLLLTIVNYSFAFGGFQRATDILTAPYKEFTPTTDIILRGNVIRCEETSYRLHMLRMRIGYAWEEIFTDYGFRRNPRGVDLINPRRKIAIELKNGYKINSIVKRANHRALKQFKRQYPDYTVIYGFINYKNDVGKSSIKEGIHYMYGNVFLNYIFRVRKNLVVNRFRSVVDPLV